MATTSMQVCMMLAIAVEISGAKWWVGSYSGGKHVRRKVLDYADMSARLHALLQEVADAIKWAGGDEHTRVVVAYEAGQEGFWLVRALRARGIAAEVIDPASLQRDSRGKHTKTDRVDMDALARAVYRWMSGDSSALRMVRVPSREDEDNRQLHRELQLLKGEYRGIQDRISKKLITQKVHRWSPAALREGKLIRDDGEPIGPMMQRTLEMELDRQEQIGKMIAELESMTAELSPQVSSRIRGLQMLKGIGKGAVALALTLYWRDFENRRQVGACTGLVGVPYNSGTMVKDQGISKQGDPRVRALLVELSWFWLRYQPDSAISQWFFRRTQGQGKRHKRVMIVAVARRLAIALWRYLKDGVIPEGAQLKHAAKA